MNDQQKNHYSQAVTILRRVTKARARMDGQMVTPTVAAQVQAAIANDLAAAQVHATLATIQP